jgi:phosphoribosylformylglycinamidine synthase
MNLPLLNSLNCDQDAIHAIRLLGHSPASSGWDASLGDTDCVIVPGGFSYGDYLRCGAIARFSPVMQAVKQFADNGGLVLGICNGFQVLTEAGLLPGALIRNRDLQFHCENVFLKTTTDSPFTGRFRREIPPRAASRTAKAAILPTKKRSRNSGRTIKSCGNTATPPGT